MKTTHTTKVSNVLVIGTGAAGLRAALAAHAAGREVVIVGKRLRKDAHTVLAAGGINAALGTVHPADTWQHHFADTVIEGHFIGNPRAVDILAREAPRVTRIWPWPSTSAGQSRPRRRHFSVLSSVVKAVVPINVTTILIATLVFRSILSFARMRTGV